MANSDELAMMDKANTDEARLRKTSRRLYCLPQGRATSKPLSFEWQKQPGGEGAGVEAMAEERVSG